MKSTDGEILVLESVESPNALANPYVKIMAREMERDPRISIQWFSWKRALLGNYDVIHIHWPEALLRSPTALRRAPKAVLFLALLLRIRFSSKKVVRTVHNRNPHEAGNRFDTLALKALDRLTNHWVGLSPLHQPGSPFTVVPHPHYRGSYPEPLEERDSKHPTISFFGLIRPYKGLEELVAAFDTVGPPYRLEISGKPLDDSIASMLRRFSSDRDNVNLDLYEIDDQALSNFISKGTLIALPIRNVLNSGSALLALSFNRPVLMPRSPGSALLQDEFGPDWIHLYDGELTTTALLAALSAAGDFLDSAPSTPMDDRAPALVGQSMADVILTVTREPGTT
ncbi:hypothetical protein [Arthrobacter sp. NPDC090010]|uniref:hypothetical protein n=1 Tax=Arthrobacter sp. NPDC090010 TaxID=3363942 RepID=UPI00381DFD6E